MSGFGIIDTSCTPEAYARVTTPEDVGVFIENVVRGWPAVFFSARPLSVYMVAASVIFIFGYQMGISGGLMTMKSFLMAADFSSSAGGGGDDNNNLFFQFEFTMINRRRLSLFISSFYTAALAAWLIAPACRRSGKPMMLLASICLLCGATLTCFGTTLIVGRMLLGSGIGLSLHIMPIYVSEIIPMNAHVLFQLFHFFLNLGVVFSACVCEVGWRMGLGVSIFPALTALLFTAYLPKLAVVQRDDDAAAAAWKELLFKKKNRPHLVASTLLPLFHQLTGISVMLLLGPMILRAVGGSHLEAVVLNGYVSTLGWLTKYICEILIHVAGISRRKLIIVFGLLMLMLEMPIAQGNLDPVSLRIHIDFIHFCASAWDFITWTFLNETLPRELRAVAWRLTMSTVLICYALVAHFGIHLLQYLQLTIFAIFAYSLPFAMLLFYALLPDNIWSQYLLGPVIYLWNNNSFWKGYINIKPEEDNEEEPPLAALSAVVVA